MDPSAALEELEAFVRDTYAPLGIVASGSILRGEGDPRSDLDVFVVHAEPWRQRDQRFFAGIPTELFVNPPGQIRRYFAGQHACGQPSTAHMLSTGRVLGEADPIVDALIEEAHDWMARPRVAGDPTEAHYGVVDRLDDVRDIVDRDPVGARLLLARVVEATIEHRFRSHGRHQPRRKDLVADLQQLDPEAARMVSAWAGAPMAASALTHVEALVRHTFGTDTFFAWTSERDPVEP